MKAVIGLIVLLAVAIGGYFMVSGTSGPEADFIFVSGAEVDTLDPQAASWRTDFRVVECLYEPLLKVNSETLQLEAGTADKWEVSDDKLTYTFHIRDEAKWSNGDPVTANDYIYGWRRALTPDFAVAYSQLFYHIKGAKAFMDARTADLKEYMEGEQTEDAAKALWDKALKRFDEMVGIKAADDKTLVVTLERPTAYYLELVAFATYSPVHAKSVENNTRFEIESGHLLAKSSKYWTDPAVLVTNGPYILKEVKFKQYTLMVANEHYWNRKNMGNSSVMMKVIAEPSAAVLEYEQGRAHWLPDIPTSSSLAADLIKEQREGRRSDVNTMIGAGTYFYHFNCSPKLPSGEKNPLADPRVRRAFSMAIDRQHIVENVTRLFQPLAKTFTPVGSLLDYEPPVEAGVEFNPEEAKRLLAEAGYPNGEGIPALNILYNTGSGHEDIAQVIQAKWKQVLGVSVTLDGVEKNRTMERRRSHEYAFARGGWFGDYRDPTTFLDQFRSGDGHNDSAYSNSAYDKLLSDADSELDATKRLDLLKQAESLMISEQPIAPIYVYTEIDIFDKAIVQNLNINPWRFRQLHKVKVIKK